MSSNTGRFWIRSPTYDSVWIIGPHFYSILLAIAIYPIVKDWDSMPLWIWFVLVVGIDVSHVYSTVFRVYLDKVERQRYQIIGWLIPLGVWIVGVVAYSLSAVLFWRGLAYLAVFHFIRQQYGFTRIYSGVSNSRSWLFKVFNQYAIYFVTVLPVLIWHFSGPKRFNWFIEKDFFYFKSELVLSILNYSLLLAMAIYVATEVQETLGTRQINWPKNGLYLGTVLVWYLGIVYFDNDIIFSLTNVVAHGVPYIALIWSYKRRKQRSYDFRFLKANNILIFLGCLFLFAYVEEFFWAAFVWNEHLPAFFLNRTHVNFVVSPLLMTYVVPLLAVPQGTHYILDAFIWKIRDINRNQWTTEGA